MCIRDRRQRDRDRDRDRVLNDGGDNSLFFFTDMFMTSLSYPSRKLVLPYADKAGTSNTNYISWHLLKGPTVTERRHKIACKRRK